MPYIKTSVNVPLSEEKEKILVERFSSSISLIPGKTPDRLMLAFDGGARLSFGGTKEPAGVAEVKIKGKSTREAYNLLTAELTKILNEELQISPSRIYVKIDEVEHWGSNGRMA